MKNSNLTSSSSSSSPLQCSGTRGRALAGATLGFFFGSSAVSLFGPSGARFDAVMELTPFMLGILVAIPSLTGSLLRIPFGAWADSDGGKRPFLILMCLSVIGLCGLSWLLYANYPDNMEGWYGLMLLFGLLTGCGIAVFSVGSAQNSYWFPQSQQGRANAIYAGIGMLAPGVFAFVLPLYLSTFSFESAYLAWTIFLAVGTILYAIFSRNAPFFQFRAKGLGVEEATAKARECGETIFPKGSIKQSLITSAKIPATWYLVIIYFCTFGGFLGLTAWYPTIWKQFYGFDPIAAGLLTAMFAILSSGIRVVGGIVSDKVGGEKVSLWSMFTLAAAALCMMFCENVAMSIISTIVIAGAMGFNNAATFKMVPKYAEKAVGGASGWVGGLGAFAGFILPPVLGALVNAWGPSGYLLGFVVFVGMAILNILIIFFGLIRKNRE